MAVSYFFLWIFQFVLARLRYRLHSLITIVIAMILVASIGASIPLYTTAISQVGMIQRLENNTAEDIHVFSRVTTIGDPAVLAQDWATYRADFRLLVNDHLQAAFPGWVDRLVDGVETTAFTLAESSDQIHLAYYENWPEYVNLVEGQWPEQAAEGVLELSAARALQVQAGDQVEVAVNGHTITFTVTGIVTPQEHLDAYWTAPSPLRLEQNAQGNYTAIMLVPAAQFFTHLAQYLPETRLQFNERILFDYEQLPFDEIPAAVTALENLARDFKLRKSDFPAGVVYQTAADDILDDYHQDTQSLKQSFRILMIQVGLLALLFLFVISELVRRSEQTEIAMLKSRGAHARHIIGEQALEAALLAMLTTLLAPWIAKQTILLLVPSLGGLDYLPLRISWELFVYSGLASVLAGVILVVALLPILRQPLATRGGSTLRSIRQPWWKRYYLDFGLLLLASWGLWQIMSARAEAGNSDPQAILTQSDPIFLLTPTLVLIALGSILLRFFPPITSVIARLLATNKALIPVLAGRQVSREPVHYARIALLLGLAVGVGGFVTSYHSTIEHSQFDQSRYQAGADVRLVEKNSASGAVGIRPLAAYTEHPLVTAVSPVLRLVDVDLNQELFELGDGVVLAVDYDSLRDVAFWRDDLGELQNPYPASEPVLPAQGTALPFTPQKIGVWTRLTSSYFMEDGSAPEYGEWPLLTTQSELHLRLRDAAADPFEVTLAVQIIEGIADDALDQTLAAYATLYDETAEPDDAARAIITDSQTLSGWVYWEGDLSLPDAQGDLRLESVTLDYALPYTRNLRSFNHWQLELADFTLVDQQAQIMADWMTGDQWELVPINNSVIGDLVDDPTGQQEETTSPRGQRIIVQWNHTPDLRRGTWSFALLCNYPALPDIPVIASASFLEKNNLEIGMSFEQYLLHTDYTFRIIDSAAYYPTLYNDDAAFLVIDLASLLYVTNRNPAQAVYPSEVWVKLADGADPDVWLADLQQQSSAYFVAEQVTAVDLLATVEADPLSIGLLGLLYFSFGIVLVFSTIMLLTYTALTVHSRQSSFGVLQAFGVSSRRLVMGLAIEQLLVLGFASAVGSILGYVLTLYVLPPLANSATTQVITPPLIVYVSQSTILRHVVFMLGVLGLLLLANLLLIRQLSPAETIKMGEE